jgi:hypothetical protein
MSYKIPFRPDHSVLVKPAGCICVNRPGDASSCCVHSPRQAVSAMPRDTPLDLMRRKLVTGSWRAEEPHVHVYENFGTGPHLHLICACGAIKDIEGFSLTDEQKQMIRSVAFNMLVEQVCKITKQDEASFKRDCIERAILALKQEGSL